MTIEVFVGGWEHECCGPQFVVDQVVGDYQTVIKPLGRMFKDVEGVSGATILGDGTVALILDVNRLSYAVQRESARKAAKGSER